MLEFHSIGKNKTVPKISTEILLYILYILYISGFKAENMKPWIIHLDHQLYKALEHQYQRGLESLNENLIEIKVCALWSPALTQN